MRTVGLVSYTREFYPSLRQSLFLQNKSDSKVTQIFKLFEAFDEEYEMTSDQGFVDGRMKEKKRLRMFKERSFLIKTLTFFF